MNKDYTDAQLQAYRLRLCARMDVLWARFPGQENETLHDRWCNAFNPLMRRYQGIEEMLIERGCVLEPIPEPPK